jgi:hypothetical protein
MLCRSPILAQHLRVLGRVYPGSASADRRWVIVQGFHLPPGYWRTHTEVLVGMPDDYPLCPPGVSSRVYLRPSLGFRGRDLKNLHVGTTPGGASGHGSATSGSRGTHAIPI